jgi:hypothetical protein
MEKKRIGYNLIKPLRIQKKLEELLKSPAKHVTLFCSEVKNGEAITNYTSIHYIVTGQYAILYYYKHLNEIEEILGCPYTVEYNANAKELIITPLAIDLRE